MKVWGRERNYHRKIHIIYIYVVALYTLLRVYFVTEHIILL